MRVFISSFLSLLVLLFSAISMQAAPPVREKQVYAMESPYHVEYVWVYVRVAAPFATVPDAPLLVQPVAYEPTQLTAWYENQVSGKPGNATSLHGKPPYADSVRRVGWALTATKISKTNTALNALHGKPPYADIR